MQVPHVRIAGRDLNHLLVGRLQRVEAVLVDGKRQSSARLVKTLEFPDSVWDAFGKVSAEVIEENLGDELFKKIYESMSSSMAQSAEWQSLSSVAYARQRTRVLGAG